MPGTRARRRISCRPVPNEDHHLLLICYGPLTSPSVRLSAASSWEIAIKHGLGRLVLPQPPEGFVPAEREAHGIAPLPIDEESTLHLSRLPALHRNPFDRLLVSQAIVHGLTIVTPDPLVTQYPARTLW